MKETKLINSFIEEAKANGYTEYEAWKLFYEMMDEEITLEINKEIVEKLKEYVK